MSKRTMKTAVEGLITAGLVTVNGNGEMMINESGVVGGKPENSVDVGGVEKTAGDIGTPYTESDLERIRAKIYSISCG